MSTREPIALVGISCRLPGADNVDSLWALLRDGLCPISEIPSDRYPIDDYYDPKPGASGKVITREGGYLRDIRGFDARFFRTSHREATAMDPQHRLLVETSWHAMEDAGVVPDLKRPRRAGVFVGTFTGDYRDRMLASDVDLDVYTEIGTTRSSAAGRVAHALNFDGPVITVDAACASSLVAVHLACQSLWSGESEVAIAAGANLVLAPESTVSFSRSGMLSPRGRCHFGDANADGFVRSEGVAALLLKPLSQAVADGDRVYAVVRASAVTNDARHGSGLFMTPSREGQAVLLRRAWIETEMPLERIVYIEAHGTGTRAGDPVECGAIADVIGERRVNPSPLYIGSIKTNLGHTEGCAGIAGLIKAALTLYHRYVPPSLHMVTPNPDIPWARGHLEIPKVGVSLNASGPLMAGVNSFGLSGTNAHIALETFEGSPTARRPSTGGDALVISAPDPIGLRCLAELYRGFLTERTDLDVRDVAASALSRRSRFAHRFVAIGGTRDALVESLARFEEPTEASDAPRVVLVFPGQGGQWRGMGRALVRSEPSFDARLREVDSSFMRLEGWSVRDALLGDDSWFHEVARLQPCLFALQVSLAAVWDSYGVKPFAVVGHSLGEVAAACVSGALSLDDAVRVISVRSRLLGHIRGKGAMLAVQLSAGEADSLLVGLEDRVALAVQNARGSCVLSGDPDALDSIAETLTGRGVYNTRVDVDVASHSPQVDALLGELLEALSGCAPREASVPMYSTVYAEPLDGPSLGASYWAANLRRGVRFVETVERLIADGANLFVEVGPHPVLVHPLQQTFAQQRSSAVALASLRRDDPSRMALLQALAVLDSRGVAVEWRSLYADSNFAPLPLYPFQHEDFWWDERSRRAQSAPVTREPTRQPTAGVHPWIERSSQLAARPGARLWEVPLSLASVPSLAEHCVLGSAVLPGAAYVELAYAAGCEAFGTSAITVEDVLFQEVMVIHETSTSTLQCLREPDGDARVAVRFDSLGASDADPPRAHARARVRTTSERDAIEVSLSGATTRVTGEDFYSKMEEGGVNYGPRFRLIQSADRSADTADVWITVPDATLEESARHPFHPAILDGCFQAAAAVTLDLSPLASERTTLPVSIRRIVFLARPSREMRCTAELVSGGDDAVVNASVRDASGALVLVIEGLRVRRFEARGRKRVDTSAWYHDERWIERDALPVAADDRRGVWQVLSDDEARGRAIADALFTQGQRCVVASLADAANARPRSCGGVVVHVSCGAPSGDADALQSRVIERSLAALAALRDLSDSDLKAPVWLVTEGAWGVVTDDVVSLEAAALWGLARVVSNERTGCALRKADLPSNAGDVDWEMLARCLITNGDDDEIAIRGARVYAHQLRAMPAPEGDPVALLSSHGTWVITGGTGGIGMALTRWAARLGARHFALLSRSGARSTEVQQRLEALRSAGVDVRVIECDVADEAALTRAFAVIDGSMPAVIGVFHLAGVLADGTLPQQNRARFEAAMSPKVRAAYNLHRATNGRSLKAFVMFSSAAGALGSPGQANYAAANTCIDALACHRRSLGLPGTSVQWGTWADVGLAAKHDDRGGRLESRGLFPMSPNDALDAMGRALDASAPPVFGIYAIDWNLWTQSFPAAGRSERITAMRALNGASAGAAQKAAEDFTLLSPEKHLERVVEILRTEVAAVLRSPVSRLSSRQSLLQLGMDSLMTVELVGRIRESLHIQVSPARLLDAPSIEAIAKTMLERPAARVSEFMEVRNVELPLGASICPSLVSDDDACDAFLTGATGFLGSHILRELLDRTGTRIRCLVRAPDASSAMQRVIDAMTHYEIARPGDRERIVPVLGDLASSRLGLSHDDFSELASNIGDIYHAGAWVNHLLPYSRLRATNVEGTREVLRLACTAGMHRVHYVSTLGVFPFSTDPLRARIYTEDSPLEAVSEPFFGGYAESKRVAEEWIVQARARGLRVDIYRPGAITGSTHAASAPTSDALWRIVKGITELGAAPAITRGPSMTPVDGVARAIVALSLTQRTSNHNFHLLHPETLSFGELIGLLRQAGFPIVSMKSSHWRRRCLESLGRESAMYPMLPRLQGVHLERLDATPVRYSSAQTWELLSPEDRAALACPAALVTAYIQRLQREGFFPAPHAALLSPSARPSARPSTLAPSHSGP